MRRYRVLTLTFFLVAGWAFGQVTTSPSVSGVAAPQSSVAISGGSINGATVGSTTPAAGAFTTLTSSGATSHSTTLAVGGTALNASPAAGLQFNGSSANFFIRTNGAEAYFTGASNFFGCLNSGCVLNLTSGAASTALTLSGTGAVAMPGLASSSAATTGTLCWTTGTGNVNVDTTVACLASTIKVKRAIEPLNIGLNEVMLMRPVSYELKPEFNPEHLGRQVGLIAEEVAKIDDRLIAVDDKGDPRGVRYMQMTAVLIKAIQEQQKQINHLKRTITSLSKGKP